MKTPLAFTALVISLNACTPWLPRAQAEAAGPPSVMLAQPYRAGSFDPRLHWVSEKYDGVRAYWDGERLWTRHGREIQAPAWFTAGWPRHAMDGELWAGRGRFSAAASAVAGDARDEAAWRPLRYMVFDLPDAPGTFEQRLRLLQVVVHALNRPWVEGVAQERVADEAGLQVLLQRTLAAGGEGLVLRRGDAAYRRERSDALLKLKAHDDAEARVVGHVPGDGKYRGQIGALWVERPDGRRFRLGSGLKDEDRRHPPPIGAIVTYRFNGFHESGLPRFASFLRLRPD